MLNKIDRIDRGILYALDTNARQSAQQIARSVDVSKEVVQYRIKRLERAKVIEGYYTLIDYATLGYVTIMRVYLKLQNEDDKVRNQMIDELAENPGTVFVYSTDFAWDIVIGFPMRTIKEGEHNLQNFAGKYRRHIANIGISFLSELIYYPRKYLSPSKVAEVESVSTGVGKVQDLNRSDLKLLKLIARDAKVPVVKLAQQLNLTSSAVIYKLRRLEKEGVILAYKVFIDFNKLGYEYYKVDVELEDYSLKHRMQSFLRRHPNVIYENRMVGGSDLEFDVEVPAYEDFVKLGEELKATFPQKIRSYTFYRARKMFKALVFPQA